MVIHWQGDQQEGRCGDNFTEQDVQKWKRQCTGSHNNVASVSASDVVMGW